MTQSVFTEVALVAAGAAVGGAFRYFTVNYATFGIGSFVGTFIANFAGCLLIGILWAVLEWANAPRSIYLLLVTGLLGGYTTFSAFALDTVAMLEHGMWLRGLGYAAASVLGGIAACAAGLFATRALIKILQ